MKDSIFYLIYMMAISIICAWKLDEGFHIPIITTGLVLGFYYAIKAIERLKKKP